MLLDDTASGAVFHRCLPVARPCLPVSCPCLLCLLLPFLLFPRPHVFVLPSRASFSCLCPALQPLPHLLPKTPSFVIPIPCFRAPPRLFFASCFFHHSCHHSQLSSFSSPCIETFVDPPPHFPSSPATTPYRHSSRRDVSSSHSQLSAFCPSASFATNFSMQFAASLSPESGHLPRLLLPSARKGNLSFFPFFATLASS